MRKSKIFSVLMATVAMLSMQMSVVHAIPPLSNRERIEKVTIKDIDYPYSTGSILDTTAKVTATSYSKIINLSWSTTSSNLNKVTITLEPNYYYYFDESTTATVNGNVADSVRMSGDEEFVVSYTFPKDETVSIPNSSASLTHVITVLSSKNGQIIPNDIRAPHRKNFTVQIVPNEGYEVEEVFIDGISVGAVIEYTFRNVDQTHKIYAKFKAIPGYVPQESGDAEERIMNFEDVNTDDWFYDEVKLVYERAIFNGVSETRFAPEENMTRAMIARVLYNLEGIESDSEEVISLYEDVASSDWYAGAINWATDEGFVKGIGGNKFGPEDNVTREQVCTILYNYAKSKEGFVDKRTVVDANNRKALSKYEDKTNVSEYALNPVDWAIAAGIMTGKSDIILDPTGYATRAEIATMVTRFLENV